MYGKFDSVTEEVRGERSWEWLRKSGLKRETEGLLMAAQEQAIRTRNIRKVIDKEKISGKCRMCGAREETVAHIVSECDKLAQKEYKIWRHDKVAMVIHWELCHRHGFPTEEKWYDHRIEKVLENDKVKILWDFKIQTYKVIEHSRPDITLTEIDKRVCTMIDVTWPFDS